ncbi:MAG: HNH endonuclease, partial [Patescibacteria group bacterium]|nr:HNH endonuclease [Patescibacteria group bacterium]
MLESFESRCYYCGVILTTDSFHVDHKIPKYSNGTDDLNNLVPTCIKCNIAKGVRPAEDFQRILDSSGLVWRDTEYKKRMWVYNGGNPRNPKLVTKTNPGVSNPLRGLSYRENVLRRKAR